MVGMAWDVAEVWKVWSKGVVCVWCGGFGAKHGEISF